jgi:hypothetical protein
MLAYIAVIVSAAVALVTLAIWWCSIGWVSFDTFVATIRRQNHLEQMAPWKGLQEMLQFIKGIGLINRLVLKRQIRKRCNRVEADGFLAAFSMYKSVNRTMRVIEKTR